MFQAHVAFHQARHPLNGDVARLHAALDALSGVIALSHDVGQPGKAVPHKIGVCEVEQLFPGSRTGEQKTKGLWYIMLHIER